LFFLYVLNEREKAYWFDNKLNVVIHLLFLQLIHFHLNKLMILDNLKVLTVSANINIK
jgi:hypothetical protein